MINNPQKTIPYRLSEAELENIRLLRKRKNPSSSIQDEEKEEKIAEEINASNSDPDPSKRDRMLNPFPKIVVCAKRISKSMENSS